MNANAMPEPTVSIEEESTRTLDSETSETREQIRRQVLAERAALPKPYRLHKSSAICDELETSLAITCATISIDPPACTIAVYAAFEEEVQLDQFIRAAYAQGTQIAFPCIVEDAWGLEGAPQQTMEIVWSHLKLTRRMRFPSSRIPCANTITMMKHCAIFPMFQRMI